MRSTTAGAIAMVVKEKFFEEHNLSDAHLDLANITWEELHAIDEAYEKITDSLINISKDFLNDYLYDLDNIGIHSYRHRIKEADHLLEKIVRKRIDDYDRFDGINPENFHKYMTDLIGIRVFFLYREDWVYFHRYITSIFENNPDVYVVDRLADFDDNPDHYYIAERPKVYKRSGDSKIYDSKQLDVIADGIYRSLHYIIKYKGYYIEIQGRTLFEEGWGEIDHNIVYPHFMDDEMLRDYSKLLNRLSGLADEMSSFFRRMKAEKEHFDRFYEENKPDA